MVERISIESGGFASRYLPLIIFGLISLGIYASLKNRAIFKRQFWLFVYLIVGILILSSLVIAIYLFLFVSSKLAFAGGLLLLAGLLVPALLKLRQYCSKSASIW